MSAVQYTEKFIAFLDVLGWKSLVRASDKGCDLSLGELCEIMDNLGNPADREHFEKYGPRTCPQAPYMRKDMDFCITRLSDSALISAEVSPAGLINLVSYCFRAYTGLLSRGVMCRGYIKRGRIYHTSEYQIGVGISDVVAREKQVSIFRKDAAEQGTPFIEIDMDVVRYVSNQPDECVKEAFQRFVEVESDLATVFPFKRLDPSIFFGPRLGQRFNPERERESVNVVRGWIQRIKEYVQHHVDWPKESARQKGNQYIRMLDARLVDCDRMDDAINLLAQALPVGSVHSRRLSRAFLTLPRSTTEPAVAVLTWNANKGVFEQLPWTPRSRSTGQIRGSVFRGSGSKSQVSHRGLRRKSGVGRFPKHVDIPRTGKRQPTRHNSSRQEVS